MGACISGSMYKWEHVLVGACISGSVYVGTSINGNMY